MSYLYSGKFEIETFIRQRMHAAFSGKIGQMKDKKQLTEDIQKLTIEYLIDFLRVADEYLLENVKCYCQLELIKLIDDNSYDTIQSMGEIFNAEKIIEYCQWFHRRRAQRYNLTTNSVQSESVVDSGGSGGSTASVNGSADQNSLSSTIP